MGRGPAGPLSSWDFPIHLQSPKLRLTARQDRRLGSEVPARHCRAGRVSWAGLGEGEALEHAGCRLPELRAQPASGVCSSHPAIRRGAWGVSRSPMLLLCVPLCLAARVQLSPTLTNVNLLPPQGLGTGVWECHGNSCLGEGKAPVVFSPGCRQQSSSSLFSWIRLVKRSTSPVTKVCGAGEVTMC